MAPKVPHIKLSNGQEMPMLGLGTYALLKVDTIRITFSIDYILHKHIDTASCYKNEEELGQAILNKINQGVLQRDELFVTTKLWNDCHSERDVLSALKESLSRLKLDYTWKGMEGVLKANLTRAIGVSNFNEEQLGRLLNNAAVKPVCNQIEIQRGIPALPKSFTKSRIEENINIFDFELNETEMNIVQSYNIDH
ncbi:Uncharacterized protein OBRU01_22314, partial [Operophtera brumata]